MTIENGAMLTVENCALSLMARTGMISRGASGTCCLIGATTLSISGENEVVKGIADFTLDRLSVIRPDGATFSKEKKGFVRGDHLIAADRILIGDPSSAPLGIFIGGQELTIGRLPGGRIAENHRGRRSRYLRRSVWRDVAGRCGSTHAG